MWKETIIMATANDVIPIMQKVGIGYGLPPSQYQNYYNKIKEEFSDSGPHKLYVLGWKKRGRSLRVPIIKISYILEDIDVDLLELVIRNNHQFYLNMGFPPDKFARHVNTLIEEYNKCNG